MNHEWQIRFSSSMKKTLLVNNLTAQDKVKRESTKDKGKKKTTKSNKQKGQCTNVQCDKKNSHVSVDFWSLSRLIYMRGFRHPSSDKWLFCSILLFCSIWSHLCATIVPPVTGKSSVKDLQMYLWNQTATGSEERHDNLGSIAKQDRSPPKNKTTGITEVPHGKFTSSRKI